MLRIYCGIGFLAVILLIGLGSRPCNGQTTLSARASVTVTVVSGISAASPAALNVRGFVGKAGNLEVRSEASKGADLVIAGPPAGMVWINFPSRTTLWNADGNLLSFTPMVAWKGSDAPLASSTATIETTDGNASLNSNGPLLIKFGGSINPEGAANGSYCGVYKITVIY
jgi:hypothetical protein